MAIYFWSTKHACWNFKLWNNKPILDKNAELTQLRVQIDYSTMEKVKMQVERDNLKGDAVELR